MTSGRDTFVLLYSSNARIKQYKDLTDITIAKNLNPDIGSTRMYFYNGQAIDHQQKQVCTDRDNIAHGSLSSLFTHIIENFN